MQKEPEVKALDLDPADFRNFIDETDFQHITANMNCPADIDLEKIFGILLLRDMKERRTKMKGCDEDLVKQLRIKCAILGGTLPLCIVAICICQPDSLLVVA